MSGDRVSRQRILVGGVPFGRDNVGDEAILECVVGIVRELAAEAEIWVSTDDQEAPASKLSVKTRPLFGFDPPGFSRDEMFSALEAVDVFIWSGATGLSDYPEIPLALLSRASERGKRTAIFCTGMNTELNPYLYTLLPGVRHKLFSAIKTASFGMIDLIARYESSKRKVAASEMRKGIQSADKVILRDAPSLESMEMLIGAPERAITIGADPAIEIQPKAVEVSGFKDDVKAVVREPCKKIGLCISAQSPVKQMKDVARVFDRLVADEGAKIVGIPMNPITDAKLMNEFRNELERPEAMVVAEGRFEPDEVTGLAAEMDVVISSRRHPSRPRFDLQIPPREQSPPCLLLPSNSRTRNHRQHPQSRQAHRFGRWHQDLRQCQQAQRDEPRPCGKRNQTRPRPDRRTPRKSRRGRQHPVARRPHHPERT
jgi:polysaccharide pyruvyl transferase WcaK-like protein